MTSRLLSATAGGTKALMQALADSRERWRMLLRDCADFAFETDSEGRFTALAPDQVLGWRAPLLIGTRAESLLLLRDDGSAADLLANPFRTETALLRRRVWLRDASGEAACLLISAAPIAGRPGAVHGVGIDVTEHEQRESERAATLLQRDAARTLSLRMRRSAVPFASLSVGLAELVQALDATGAALVLHEHGAPLRVAAKAGAPWPDAIQSLHDAVLAVCEQPPTWLLETVTQTVTGGQSLMLCAGANHFIDRAVLALWRADDGWSEEETALARSLLQAIQPILEHEQIQRETARLSRTDILTGLFNRQGFMTELARRFARLDREGLPATLIVVGLDGLSKINAEGGIDRGDAVLCDTAAALRDLVRPTDLAGRLGGDLFALWLDGADQFAAAERADSLRRTGIKAADGPGAVMVSIGLAVRFSRSFESIESLLHRAWTAMRAVKERGGAGWQVSAEEPSP